MAFVNHFRCLLLNADGSAPKPEYLAEEVVDPAYRAVALPAGVLAVRGRVFGPDPDRHFLNYRTRQLLACVHASFLAEYVAALDPRLTYDFLDPRPLDPRTFGVAVTPLAGAAGLVVTGTPAEPDVTGRCAAAMRVDTTAPGEARLSFLTPPRPAVSFAFASGRRAALPGTGLFATFADAAAGQGWLVDTLARPARTLGDVVDAAAGAGEPALLAVFGAADAEPFRSFREVWNSHRELPARVAALACGLAYRAEEVRLGR
jgi:hypothetical protein